MTPEQNKRLRQTSERLRMLQSKVKDSSLAGEIYQAREDIKWVLAEEKIQIR
jgi:hypothetical protein